MILSFDKRRTIKDFLNELYGETCSYTKAASPPRLPSELILYAHLEFFHKINKAFASLLEGDNKYREQRKKWITITALRKN